MALGKSVNSYATVAEADAYFVDRLDVAAWVNASSDEKAQALVTATSQLDLMEWVGIAVSVDQALAFPRVGSYYEPRVGMEVELTSTVPTRIVKATYELAYHFLNNDGILDDTGSVVDLQIASISLTKVRNANSLPAVVKKLVAPLRLNGGSSAWWRAN
jgi:hypothetical protein